MTTFRLLRPVERADIVAIGRLHDAAEAADGHPALNDSVWRDLDSPDAGSAGVLACDGDQAIGYAHVSRGDSRADPHWEIGLVVHPDHRADGLERALLDRVVEHIAREGGGAAVVWVLGAGDGDDAALAPAGFARQRDLLEMRVTLPLAAPPASLPPGVRLRRFEPGSDDDAWLTVNNRAFAGHPEQGGWTRATLRQRMSEPWFDPDGFLLAVDEGGAVAAFCWTRVHPPEPGEPDARGEIFVIGVDPAHHGSGLGRALTVSGLASLAERGITAGVLFVDGANEAAVGLYQSLGFVTHRRDRAYVRDIPAA